MHYRKSSKFVFEFLDLLYIASPLKIKAKLMELFYVVLVKMCTVEPV